MNILGNLLKPLKDLVSEAIVDVDKKREIELEMRKLESTELVAQTEVNKVEAAHRSIFVAGWRPFIGWGCGTALLYTTILAPAFELPVTDLPFLRDVLLGMLGLAGGMRTLEKIKGVSNDYLPLKKASVEDVETEVVAIVPPGFSELPENAPWSK